MFTTDALLSLAAYLALISLLISPLAYVQSKSSEMSEKLEAHEQANLIAALTDAYCVGMRRSDWKSEKLSNVTTPGGVISVSVGGLEANGTTLSKAAKNTATGAIGIQELCFSP